MPKSSALRKVASKDGVMRIILIKIATVLLLALSFFATLRGVKGFLTPSDEPALWGVLTVGDDLTFQLLVFGGVAALTLVLYVTITEMVRPRRPWTLILSIPLYFTLTLWSVGFGYGFWWSQFAGDETTTQGLRGQTRFVTDSISSLQNSVADIRGQIASVQATSDQKAKEEEVSGGSCGIASSSGRGRLYRARMRVSRNVSSLLKTIETQWLSEVQKSLNDIEGKANKRTQSQASDGNIKVEPNEDARTAFERRSTTNRRALISISMRSEQLGKRYANDLRIIAERLRVRPEQDNFTCYDTDLASQLEAAADSANAIERIEAPEPNYAIGNEGVAVAIRNLIDKVVGVFSRQISNASDRADVDLIGKNASLEGREYLAIMIAILVDLALIVLVLFDPPRRPPVPPDALNKSEARTPLTTNRTREFISEQVELFFRDIDVGRSWIRQNFFKYGKNMYLIVPRFENDNVSDKLLLRSTALMQLAFVLIGQRILREPSRTEEQNFLDALRFNNRSPAKENDSQIHNSDSVVKNSMDEDQSQYQEYGELSKAAKRIRQHLRQAEWPLGSEQFCDFYPLVDPTSFLAMIEALKPNEDRQYNYNNWFSNNEKQSSDNLDTSPKEFNENMGAPQSRRSASSVLMKHRRSPSDEATSSEVDEFTSDEENSRGNMPDDCAPKI